MTLLKNIAWGVLGLFVFMFAVLVLIAIFVGPSEEVEKSRSIEEKALENTVLGWSEFMKEYETLVPWDAKVLHEPGLISEELYQPCVISLMEHTPDMKLQEEILFTHWSALVYGDALTAADRPSTLGRYWGSSEPLNGQAYNYYCDLTWSHWIHSDNDKYPVVLSAGIEDPLAVHSQMKKIYHVSDEQYDLFMKTWDVELLTDDYQKAEEDFDRAVRRYNIDREYTFDHCHARATVLDYWSEYDQHIRNLRASYDVVGVYPDLDKMPLLEEIYERYNRWASNSAVKRTIKDSYRDREDMTWTCGRGHAEWDHQWKNLIDEIAQ